MSFVGLHYDLNSASVTAVMYAISCHIGPRYNGTRLYIYNHFRRHRLPWSVLQTPKMLIVFKRCSCWRAGCYYFVIHISCYMCSPPCIRYEIRTSHIGFKLMSEKSTIFISNKSTGIYRQALCNMQNFEKYKKDIYTIYDIHLCNKIYWECGSYSLFSSGFITMESSVIYYSFNICDVIIDLTVG